MSTVRNPSRWLAAVAAGTTMVCGSTSMSRSAAMAATPQTSAARDPRSDMITTLRAFGPHPSLGDQARTFDRFVGTWDCDYGFIAPDGTVTRFNGELIVGWILDGRAVQDIWISYPRSGDSNERRIGTSVRFYDTRAGVWRVVFVAPTDGGMITLTGGVVEDRIVLKGKDGDGSSVRWSFNEIRSDSFVWRGETSDDEGKTWVLTEEHSMKRRKT